MSSERETQPQNDKAPKPLVPGAISLREIDSWRCDSLPRPQATLTLFVQLAFFVFVYSSKDRAIPLLSQEK